ncbi:MAG: WD40 repeat domain-containing protein [Planctomycetales bacterium]
MGIRKSLRRALGGSDAEQWRQPPYFRMRLARDAGPRLLYALGMGLGISGPINLLLLASAPAAQLAKAFLLAGAMTAAMLVIVFFWIDLVIVTVSLESDGIRRKTKALLMNPFGARTRTDNWSYQTIQRCGLVSADDLGTKYSVLVLGVAKRMIALGIPENVELQQVAQALTERGLNPKPLRNLPAEALPGTSVDRHKAVRGTVAAVIGLLLAVGGLGSRPFIHAGGGAAINSAAVEAQVETAPVGRTVRRLTGVGAGGLTHAQISPDGRWVWGVDKESQQHRVWNDQQDQPAGALTIPAATQIFAEFTDDGRRLMVCADRRAFVWTVEPLEQVGQFDLKELPDGMALSRDAGELIVVSMVSVRAYALPEGRPVAEHPNLPPNAVVGVGLSGDGKSVRIACQSRILSIDWQGGTVTELFVFDKPQKAYLFGSVGGEGRFAAMQGNGGIEVFDLNSKTQSHLTAGLGYHRPVITDDGSRVAVPSLNGVGVWNVRTGVAVSRFTDGQGVNLCVAARGERLLGWSPSRSVLVLWEMPPAP